MPHKKQDKKFYNKRRINQPLTYNKNNIELDEYSNVVDPTGDAKDKDIKLSGNSAEGKSDNLLKDTDKEREAGIQFDSNEGEERQKKTDRTLLRAISFFSQVGITIAASLFIGVFIGRFLDKRLGTEPWLLLVFSLLGMLAAVKTLFDLANKK